MVELWGGAECTVSRVGDTYRDQLDLTGHGHREQDVDLLAELGLKALRVPVLWEQAVGGGEDADWRRADHQLARLRALNIRPIVGLIHHGSGPPHTSLLSDDFASGLAGHAARVAARYGWVEEWAPVNEPLTTARFAALYGYWYPHVRDEGLFWRALVNQIDAIRLSMQAIRTVVPHARLIQTEDLGRTYATALVREQAAFDNQRRWMTWDLLCGRVTPDHPMWDRLSAYGLGDRLRAIMDDPCPPDIFGINHYLTSDRFLDHRLDRYPEALHGGSPVQRYADTEAVRVLDPSPNGWARAIADCWARYGSPIAITEVQNNSTRDEQLRWFAEAWQTAFEARAAGIDIRAVTSWALFGSQGWNTLLTRTGLYEPGAFDSSAGTVRPTAMANLLKAIASAQEEGVPVVARTPGWWRRGIRFTAPAQPRPAPMIEHRRMLRDRAGADHAPVLILGRTGTLGQALAAACAFREIPHQVIGRETIDVTDPASIEVALDQIQPWAVINATGWVRVDDAELDPAGCEAVNVTGAAAVAAACAARGLPNVHFSTDLVFDGALRRPYVESDLPNPVNVYGRSKQAGEARIAAAGGPNLVIRTSAFFSPNDPYNFAHDVIERARLGQPMPVTDDCISPTYVPDLANAVLDLLIDDARGIWHLSNNEALAWSDFARQLCVACGISDAHLVVTDSASMGWRAPRPAWSPLGSERGVILPPLDGAIAAFAAACAPSEPAWAPLAPASRSAAAYSIWGA